MTRMTLYPPYAIDAAVTQQIATNLQGAQRDQGHAPGTVRYKDL